MTTCEAAADKREEMGLIEVRDFTGQGWTAPDQGKARARWYCEQLEEGKILFFEHTPFPLPDEERAFLLQVRQASATYHKNISYRPGQDRVKGFARGSADENTLRTILRAYSQRVIRFASEFLLPYAQRWQLDVASFRPVEEEGRRLPRRARNDLLHIDSFPSRPTHGNRILRVFSNLNPMKSRIWITTQTFDILAPQFATAAGLPRIVAHTRSPFRRWQRRFVRLARAAGAPLLERSPYDEFMLRFHHYLKTDQTFQERSVKYRWEFPPNSTWLVFTDMVPHAVLAGQYALEQTFLVSRDALLLPRKAPLHVLEELAGAPLTN